MTKEYTPQQILSLPMEDNDAGAATIGQYFTALLHTIFLESEGFSGKRLFGNSGWEHEIYTALLKADAIWGELDEDGCIEDCDSALADAIIRNTINFLHKADWNTLTLPVEPTDWYVVYLDTDGNGMPVMSDAYRGGLTEKDAKREAEGNNSDSGDTLWRAIHIPK